MQEVPEGGDWRLAQACVNLRNLPALKHAFVDVTDPDIQRLLEAGYLQLVEGLERI